MCGILYFLLQLAVKPVNYIKQQLIVLFSNPRMQNIKYFLTCMMIGKFGHYLKNIKLNIFQDAGFNFALGPVHCALSSQSFPILRMLQTTCQSLLIIILLT